MFSFFDKSNSPADIYIDLGTANTLVCLRDKGLVINEPSIIAYNEVSAGKRKIIAVGLAAKEKIKTTPGNIVGARPLKEGVIADLDTTEVMLDYFLSLPQVKSKFSRPRLLMSLPHGVTDVEKKAMRKAGRTAGAKAVLLVDEPMLAAIGAGVPVDSARGHMIVDIGGGTTEVAVIALADIVYCQPIRIGGNKLDTAIVDYMKNKKNLIINEATAEQIKIAVGTATTNGQIEITKTTGRDVNGGLQKTMEISSEDIGQAMAPGIQAIIHAINQCLEQTPPELVSDLIETGIVLTGGGAQIKNLAVKISKEVKLPVRVAENPIITIARGGEKLLNDPELLNKVILREEDEDTQMITSF